LSRRFTAVAIVVAAMGFAATPAQDAEESPDPRPHRGILTLTLENDVFLRQDSQYTHGLAFTWTTTDVGTLGERSFFKKMLGAVRFLPTFGDDDRGKYATVRFGQEMYTPSDISDPDPPLEEQPYAGILSLDTGVHSRSARSLHDWILRLGIVGPVSGAEQMQRLIHEILGTKLPQGWDTQLSNEFLLNLDYRYRHRLHRTAGPTGFGHDSTLSTGGGFGNYYIGASAGINVRVGWCLPETYGTARVRGNQSGMVGWQRPPGGRWRVYLQAGVEAYAVARFLPTDGNTFTDSRSADRDGWFVLVDVGPVISRGRFHAEYTYTATIGGTDSTLWSRDQDYGVVTLSWLF
jgi:lipid A 3-O-deacylase